MVQSTAEGFQRRTVNECVTWITVCVKGYFFCMLIFFRLYCMVIRTLSVAVIFSSSQGSLRNDKVGLLCFVGVFFTTLYSSEKITIRVVSSQMRLTSRMSNMSARSQNHCLRVQLDCFGKSELYFYTVIINIITPHIQFKFYFLQFKSQQTFFPIYYRMLFIM